MLIEFRFKNYRSFRDEAMLSMEATGIGSFKSCLISCGATKLLPSVAIYGKNAGGKSNVIRAFWLAAQFVKNAQRIQYGNAMIPVVPFALNDYSAKEPTEFEFIYVFEGVKYWYSFSATNRCIIKESLFHAPKGQKALVFSREKQAFTFTENKPKRKLISETVSENQLFFSVACTMNDTACVKAMKWFRERIFFSRDYTDIPTSLLEYSNDKNMLRAISDYTKMADLGIEDMQFKLKSLDVTDYKFSPDYEDGVREEMGTFMQALSDGSHNATEKLKYSEIKAIASHQGVNAKGKSQLYQLDLEDESDGTRRLMLLAPVIESALRSGGLVLVDELERELHPGLVDFVVSKFQSRFINKTGAQLIFTTHNTELLNMELIRKDQVYFADKNRENGVSELYSISTFGTKTADNIRKGYLSGKYGAVPNVEIEEVE